MGLRMQPRNEKFFTLFSKAGSNVIVSAAILMEFVATGLGALVVRLGKTTSAVRLGGRVGGGGRFALGEQARAVREFVRAGS